MEKKLSWDSQAFLNELKEVTTYSEKKCLRVKEYKNTIDLVQNGGYVTEDGCSVELEERDERTYLTQFYTEEIPKQEKLSYKDEAIEVVNEDCLAVGIHLKEEGYYPAILNMASRTNPGGGVTTGCGAQEETLFRRTDLFRSLYQFTPYAELYGLEKSAFQYPLDRNYGGVYTPGALIFREGEPNGYKLMKDPVRMDFITVAGINRPDLTPDNMIESRYIPSIKNKIRTILRIGLRHGNNALVLGALGCGAFRNPPRHTAKLFHEVLEEEEFNHKFRLIVFAIIDDQNAYKTHNPEGNFKPFNEEFEGMGRSQK